MHNWFRLLAYDLNLPDDVLLVTALMDTPGMQSVWTFGVLRYPPVYSFENYISLHVINMNKRQLAIMPSIQAFTMRAGFDEKETAIAGWCKRWKHKDGRQDTTAGIHR